MSRRRRPEKREILPDPKFGDQILSKFMNNLMLDGKKSVEPPVVPELGEHLIPVLGIGQDFPLLGTTTT